MTEIITNLNKRSGTVLLQQDSADGVIRVNENKHYRWLDFGTEYIQAAMYRADSHQLVLQYTQAMMLAHALKPRARRLLNLGAGCGTFERFHLANCPTTEITSIESDPNIVEISKRFFYLPPKHKVHIGTAEKYVRGEIETADIVLCDLHNGANTPDCIYSVEFYADILSSMATDGVLALNLLPSSEKELSKALKALRRVFKWQSLLDFENIGNIVIFASPLTPPNTSKLTEQANRFGEQCRIDFAEHVGRLRALPEAFPNI